MKKSLSFVANPINEAKNMPFEAAIWFGIENGVTFGMTQDLWYGTC